jgi:hypothetical protein
MDLEETKATNDFADEGQQQFNQLTTVHELRELLRFSHCELLL